MIVCICHRVTDRDISRSARAGMSFDDLQLELGVATQCGQCESGARDLHSQCQTQGQQAFCHKAGSPTCGQTSHTAPIQLATSILESTSWTRSLPLPAALSLP